MTSAKSAARRGAMRAAAAYSSSSTPAKLSLPPGSSCSRPLAGSRSGFAPSIITSVSYCCFIVESPSITTSVDVSFSLGGACGGGGASSARCGAQNARSFATSPQWCSNTLLILAFEMVLIGSVSIAHFALIGSSAGGRLAGTHAMNAKQAHAQRSFGPRGNSARYILAPLKYLSVSFSFSF